MPTFGGGVNAKELAVFTRQFSVMIDAGLPLVQCLEILAGQQENKIFQKVLAARARRSKAARRCRPRCGSIAEGIRRACTSTWWKRARRAVFSTPFCSAFDIHRKEREAEARGEVGVGLSGRRV